MTDRETIKTCADCIHDEICETLWQKNNIPKLFACLCGCFKEKSRYIELPCKVGDKVYLPCLNDWGDIENYTITEFVLDNDGLLFVVDDEDRETHPIEEIGTDVFLTKEEAEQAIKGCE